MGRQRDELFFGDLVRLYILHEAIGKPICGVEFVAKLVRHGYRLGPGKVYPVLHALKRAGYLAGRFVIACGKRRQYYEATGKGRDIMRVAKARLHELAGELLKPTSRPTLRRSSRHE
jgi:DNA-binding PadR family transcriptional regulator